MSDSPPLLPPEAATALVDAVNSVSPTGKPLVNPKAVPWIAAALPVVGLLLNAIPAHTVVGKALRTPGLQLVLGSLLGLASPGLRRPRP
jgi:hypothetical protein